MATPALVQHVSTQPEVIAAVNEPIDNLVVKLPNASLTGNTLVCVVAYPSGATPAITDDKGNTWPASGATGTVTADAGAGAMALQAFVLTNATVGTRLITVGFGGSPQEPVRAWVSEYYNVTGTLQGSATAANVNSSGTVSPGAFTPSAANCLILSYMSDANTSGTTNPTLISANTGAGFALNDADISWTAGTGTPSASQWFAQGTAASITGSFTLTSGGTETYNVIAFALSTGSQGTAKPAGIHIDRAIFFGTSSCPASWKFQIPSTGNLGVLMSFVDQFASALDSDSVTWTAKGVGTGFCPCFFRDGNQPASTTRTITITVNTGAIGINGMFTYFDISGAATSAFDVFAGNTGAPSNVNTIANMPSITPTVAGDLVIAALSMGLGPTSGVTSPSGALFGSPTAQIAQFTAKIDNGSGSAGTTLTVSSTAWGTIVSGSGGVGAISGAGVTLGTTPQSGTGPTYTVQPSQLVTPAETMHQSTGDGSIINWGDGYAWLYNATTSTQSWTWSIAEQPGNSCSASAIAFIAAPTSAQGEATSVARAPKGMRLGTPMSRLRGVLGITPPAAMPPSFMPQVYAAPQSVDVTVRSSVQTPLVKGQTPPVIPLVTNANAPQLIDLTLPARLQPSLVQGQTPPVIGLLPFSPQQSYLDVAPLLWHNLPLRQGPVLAPLIVPQSAYSDPPSWTRGTAPMPQGPVPPMVTVPPQQDPSQLGTFVIPAAVRFFATGPVPPQLWATPAWDLTLQPQLTPSAATPPTTGPVILSIFGSPVWDLTQQAVLTSPLIGAKPRVIPQVFAFATPDLTQQPTVYPAARTPPVLQTGPVIPIVTTTPVWDLTQQPMFCPAVPTPLGPGPPPAIHVWPPGFRMVRCGGTFTS